MNTVLIFKVGGEEFALPVEEIRLITRLPEVEQMPHSFDFVEGIANLRGKAIAVINLAKRFAFALSNNDQKARLIVAKVHGMIVGLMVDDVVEVMDVDKKNVTQAPAVATPIDDGYVKDIADLAGRLIFVLDLEEVLSVDNLSNIRNIREKFEEEKSNG